MLSRSYSPSASSSSFRPVVFCVLCPFFRLCSLKYSLVGGRAGLLGNLMFAAHSTVPAVTSGRRNAGAKSPSPSLCVSVCLSVCLSVCFSLSSELCEQGGTHSLSLSLSLSAQSCVNKEVHTLSLSLSAQSCVNKEVHTLSLSQLRAV